MRNPMLLNRLVAVLLYRSAERKYLGQLPQEPPRNTRSQDSSYTNMRGS